MIIGRNQLLGYLTAAPVKCFAFVQLFPLLLWSALPATTLNVALGGATKAPASLATYLAYTAMVLAFAIGSVFGLARAGGEPLPQTEAQRAILLKIHYSALAFSMFGCAAVIGRVFTQMSPYEMFLLLGGQANMVKKAVYDATGLTKILIMPRHLALLAFASWCLLRRQGVKPRTLIPTILCAATVFLLTSGRLMMIGFIAIFLVERSLTKVRISSKTLMQLALAGTLGILLFMAGTVTRAANTWTSVSGDSNPFFAARYEIFGYLASPVNYSTALVESGSWGRDDEILLSTSTWWDFVATAFSLDAPQTFRTDMGIYYNDSSLNQVGLVAIWYAGYGPFFFLHAILYGTIVGMALGFAKRGSPYGALLYLLAMVSIFDSFRGFLFMENVIASNTSYLLLCRLVLGYGAEKKSARLQPA